ncbi:Uncharacterised protein [Achromobacter sp. 2789STDY5608621]|nr:Uncharacterised protein [Achromobacter sp. 2789STDY5608621]
MADCLGKLESPCRSASLYNLLCELTGGPRQSSPPPAAAFRASANATVKCITFFFN